MKNFHWLPGVPVKEVLARYENSPGKELESKFENPESSANLVANAFGWFMQRPSSLPPLPGCEQLGVVEDVCVERCMRFPWRGGLHPWLDVVVETPQALIGVESKRYEPFRPKAAATRWSTAYRRNVWGSRMAGFQRMRDLLDSGKEEFQHLNAVQLVKHAFGLRTQAAKDGGRRPVLLYVYAEPRNWPDGKAVPARQLKIHREEIAAFARIVAGDEVEFHSASYAQVLATWTASGDSDVRSHAAAVHTRYEGC